MSMLQVHIVVMTNASDSLEGIEFVNANSPEDAIEIALDEKQMQIHQLTGSRPVDLRKALNIAVTPIGNHPGLNYGIVTEEFKWSYDDA